jgi:hypothetical protein
MLSRRILQIIPAEGWLAVYDHSVGDVDDLRTRPLVCWALVEDQTGTSVIGMDGDTVAGVQGSGRFAGYAKTGESLARFKVR